MTLSRRAILHRFDAGEALMRTARYSRFISIRAQTRELEQANRQLRSEIEQREIAEAEVQQLQRLDAIGQITSGVAPDFNNLPSVVLTNARLLSRNLRDRQDQEGVELIRAAAERGVNLTKQLLLPQAAA